MKKETSKKWIVFWTIHITLTALYVLTLIFSPEILVAVGTIIIIMMVGNGATLIGGRVAQAWQKSKYYRQELDHENNHRHESTVLPAR